MVDRGRWTSVLQVSLEGAESRRMTIEVLESEPRLRVVASIESSRPVGDFWHHAANFDIQLSLAAPVMCIVNGRPRMWSVTYGDTEPLEELMWWTMSELWGSELIDEGSGSLFLGSEAQAR